MKTMTEERRDVFTCNLEKKTRSPAHTLTFGHLGLRRRALTASSRAVWYWPSLRWAAERLLYRMQFCGSARRASPYSFTAVWKSPSWQASLLCRTFSMNSALLRPGPSAVVAACTALPSARGPNRPNYPGRDTSERCISVFKACKTSSLFSKNALN